MPFNLKCESCGKFLFYRRVDPRVLPIYCTNCDVTDVWWQSHWTIKKRLRQTGEFDRSPPSPQELAEAQAAMDAELPRVSREPVGDGPSDKFVFERDRRRPSPETEETAWEEWVGGVKVPSIPLEVRLNVGLAMMLEVEARSMRNRPAGDTDADDPKLAQIAEATVCYRVIRMLLLASQKDGRILDLLALGGIEQKLSEAEMRDYAFLLMPGEASDMMGGAEAGVEFLRFYRPFHILGDRAREQDSATLTIRWRPARIAIAHVMTLSLESESFTRSYIGVIDPSGTFSEQITAEDAAWYLRLLACAEPKTEEYLLNEIVWAP